MSLFAQKNALLALADGSLFWGQAIGTDGETLGEVVFNTSITGYQEILTDPSYAEQLVTLTYPHIGNVGVNPEDEESDDIWASGLIVKDVPKRLSNWRGKQGLKAYLQQKGIVAIADIDTRALTRLIREKGAQPGVIVSQTNGNIDVEAAIAKAQSFAGLQGMDLAQQVSTADVYTWKEDVWDLANGYQTNSNSQFHVVAYDFGVKRNILRLLVNRGCRVTVVPAQTPASDVLAMNPDGVFLSNGPGDPEPCDYAIQAIQTLLNDTDIPLFGICLGHQLLALASGANTQKMKFGHHGGNHPVKDITTGQVLITAQNHGFAVDATSLPAHVKATHVSLFDGTLQGIEHTQRKAFGFQGHPEASPGPEDVQYLFDRFVSHMSQA